MKITKATHRYEAWLADRTPVVRPDIALKHAAMAADAFSFFRATFYRWVQRWRKTCAAATAPAVLAVGDLHVENFGTWRDIEGRLIWGINDFDEAHLMPYTIDLVRLAASARLAIAATHLALTANEACDAIVTGYTDALAAGGQPFVLSSEHFGWLRATATGELRDPVHFWRKMAALPTTRSAVPKSAVRALERMLPEPGLRYRLAKRVSGLGSLGRQRFVALAEWRGGSVAREAKALVPSAYIWQGKVSDRILYQRILDQSVRCPDPFVRLRGRWIVRRLAPDCSRIELSSLPKERDERRLLHAMGWEIANVHLGSKRVIDAVRRDLKARPKEWLYRASKQMFEVTLTDFVAWQNAMAAKSKARQAS